jgi:arylamine N-acetyltransferase
VNNLVVQRSWPEGRAALLNRSLTLQTGRTSSPLEIRDPEHLLEALEKHFGLSFPAETRFSLPVF